MTASPVSGSEIINPGGGLATGGSVTPPFSPTEGNIILVGYAIDKDSGVIDPPDGFAPIEGIPQSNTSISLWVGTKESDGTESGAIAATWVNSRSWQAFYVEIEGTGTVAVDQSQSNITGSAVTTLSTGTTGTNSANTGFAIAGAVNDSAGSDVTESWSNSFTPLMSLDNVGAFPGVWIATGPVTPSATAETTVSDLNSDQIAAFIVTFSDTGGGGGGGGGNSNRLGLLGVG